MTAPTNPTGPLTAARRPHPLLTRAEVARALRVDPTTVDAWRREGRLLPAEVVTLPGGRYRYRRTLLARLTGAQP